MNNITPTINSTELQPETPNDDFLMYLESRRRALITELRMIEKHLIDTGRIKRTSLTPPRSDRN